MRLFVSSIFLVFVLLPGGIVFAGDLVLQSVHSNLYVGVRNDRLAAVVRDQNRALRLEKVQLQGNRIALRDVRNRQYVRAGVTRNTLLATGSPHIRGWETFELHRMGGGGVALKSVQNGKFVRAGVGRGSLLAAVSDRASSWEMFRLVAAHQQSKQSGGDLVGRWRVIRLRALQTGHMVRLPNQTSSRSRVTIDQQGRLSASVGCNTISARISHSGHRVRVSSPMMTKKRCQDDLVFQTELSLSNALRHSALISRASRGDVVFYGNDQRPLMRLRPL